MKYDDKTVTKRFFALFLACLMIALTLASCDANSSSTPTQTTLDGTTDPTTDPTGTTNVVLTPTDPVFTPPAEFEDVPVQGVYVEYYNGKDKNTFVSAAVCENIGGKYESGVVPVEGMNKTNYSIVWTGRIKAPYTGKVKFTTLADDGVILTINGTEVIVDSGPHLVESH